jgi:hypothetical protein
MTRTKLLAGLALAVAASACKPKGAGTGASVKTLDNFTRDDGTAVTTYFCGLGMSEDVYQHLAASDRAVIENRIEVAGNDRELRLAAGGALAAVPRSIQQVFFAGRGKIRIVADAQAACTQVGLSPAQQKFAAENSQTLDGCWQVSDGRVDIILKADKAVIHHGLLRLATKVYTELFAKGVDKVPGLANAVARFKKQKYALGVALLKDLAKADPQKAKSFEAFATESRDEYEADVFSEAVDQGYCSATSLAVFERQFPETYKAFSKGNDAVMKDLGAPLY